MKKLKHILLKIYRSTTVRGVVAVSVLFFIISFAGKKQEERVCRFVDIKIKEEYDNYFIDKEDVMDLLSMNNREPLVGRSYDVLRLKELEKRVKSNPLVEDAEVFRDLQGHLIVEVTQSRPIARIQTRLNGSWYISDKGKVVPTSPKYTARVPVIMGDYAWKLLNVDFKKDTSHARLFEMLSMVDKDPFLKALVADIEMDIDHVADSTAELTIYPALGNFEIQYGSMERPVEKLKNIKIAYNEILPVKGWDTYKRINIKYKNQIICD